MFENRELPSSLKPILRSLKEELDSLCQSKTINKIDHALARKALHDLIMSCLQEKRWIIYRKN